MSRYLAVIPAAGTGSRMGGTLPKQYLAVGDRPLLYYAIARFCTHPAIDRICVILAPDDRRFETYDWKPFAAKLEPLYMGGDSRAATVLNALEGISGQTNVDDWILVHDAARPCLSAQMLDRLIGEVGEDRSGGLLAVPVADTLKRGDDDRRSIRTESRAGLWQAQTPQMFRYELLLRALRSCDLGQATDEAAAVEALGFKPKLVQSDATNLKVTHAHDLALAELILKNIGVLAAK
ncbi:MAG: 2-C-methyl-D-erythritol 4-phosphate cytidylyltransferase [Betaproteobacteria bacterium]|nr:2-C-methyl-D-erythritol 4-phosphate cytidylyltransferase [Betaproteobacteria bacterium]